MAFTGIKRRSVIVAGKLKEPNGKATMPRCSRTRKPYEAPERDRIPTRQRGGEPDAPVVFLDRADRPGRRPVDRCGRREGWRCAEECPGGEGHGVDAEMLADGPMKMGDVEMTIKANAGCSTKTIRGRGEGELRIVKGASM